MMRTSETVILIASLFILICHSAPAQAEIPDLESEAEMTDSVLAEEVEQSAVTVGLDSIRGLYAGYPAAAAFASLPESVVPLLPQRIRLDMLDYGIGGIFKPMRNTLYGYSRLDSLASDYMKVAITDVSNICIGVYPAGKEKAAVLVSYTITPRDAASDSQLICFDGNMNPVPVEKLLRLPDTRDFIVIPKGEKKKPADVAGLIPFPTITYTLNPHAGTLTATLTADAAMTLEDANTLKPYLHPVIVYHWNGKRFVPLKK